MDAGYSPRIDEVSEKVGLPRKAVLILAQVDPRALGIACGVVLGFWLWLATILLVIRGGENAGQNLALLSQYFIGYRVTPIGSLLAFFYGGITGFLAGYFSACMRNFAMRAYLVYLRRRAESMAMSDMLDRFM